MTPVVPFSNDVLLKMDYLMPTLSYKDRGAAVLIAHCQSIGIDAVVQDSSGNAGNSVAAYCAKAGIACEIYVPEGTSPKKIAMIHAHQAQVHVVPGSRDHCAAVCRAQVASGGKYYASHVFNPFFYEGTKTYIYEVYEQLRHIPACLFTPLGNGTLFLGIVKGLEELLHSGLIPAMPRIVAVQSEHCDPIAQAVRQGLHTPVAVIPKPTLAEGIAIGQPMRGEEILAAIYRYKIDVVTAPEEQIIDAQAQLARRGIYCEPTSAATLAAYQALCAREGPIADCLIPITGAGLKAEH
jgi:threonine synthase